MKRRRFILADHLANLLMKRNVYKVCCWSFFLFTGISFCKGQNIDSLLSLQKEVDPQEKIYVHFDKNFYGPGETIWFKAYVFAGQYRSLDSKNFYAELRDENGNLIERKTAPVILSGAASHFDLPANFSKSTVYFRAYTKAILNGDTAFIYSKPIRVVSATKSSTKNFSVPEIKFLPEGGDCVTGLSSVIAFKVADDNGDPVNTSGYIKTSNGKKVADFATVHDGMGKFELTPEHGQTYTAVWKDEKNKEHTTSLLSPALKGMVLHVSDDEGAKKFTIQRQEDAEDNLKILTIVGIMNQQLVYQATINMSAKTMISAKIPTQDLQTGILQITVFDRAFRPVAERISFVNNSNYEFDVDAWISELNTSKRSLNRAEIKMADTLMANLSVSVTDADLTTSKPNSDNIISHILLTGDLRGRIANPYYYFFNTSDSAAIYLDLVMLTNGWRRYNWDNILAGKFPKPIYTETNYLGITGLVVNTNRGNFPEDLNLTGFLRTADSAVNLLVLPIDRKGEVLYDGLVFYDSAKMYLQFNDKNRDFDPSMFNVSNGLLQNNNIPGMNSALKEATPDIDTLVLSNNIKNNKNELKVAAKKYKDAHELGNVVVRAKAKTDIQKLDQRYASALFSSGDAKMFDVANDPTAVASFSVLQYLQGKVAGLLITGPTQNQLSWRGGTPVLYVDEMRSDVDMVSNINMSNVAYIKVFSPGSVGAISSSGGGAIAVYTKKGGAVDRSGTRGLAAINLTGYSAIRQFYSPDYATPSPEDYYEDLRTTLYWEPFVVLDKTKKRFKFQFYNNDFTKRFRIVMEGINEQGKLVHVEKVTGK